MNATTADAAATIRKDLKAAGIPARAVSVKSSVYSLGSTIHVKIKAVDVDFATVERIANKQSRVRYDEATGEVLGGANQHVTVDIDSAAVDAAVAGLTVDADGCFTLRGHKAIPVWDRGIMVGWYIAANKGWRPQCVRSAVRAILMLPTVVA